MHYRDWPGRVDRVLIYLADPGHRPVGYSDQGEGLAIALAPRWRVLHVLTRADQPPELQAAHGLALLDAFGFPSVMLVAEQGAGAAAKLIAAWRPRTIENLVVLEPSG
ncbi:MAG: hypothetical protein NVSMB2_13150 [Chloroflexota bacterium]